jgi:hypothetical protein
MNGLGDAGSSRSAAILDLPPAWQVSDLHDLATAAKGFVLPPLSGVHELDAGLVEASSVGWPEHLSSAWSHLVLEHLSSSSIWERSWPGVLLGVRCFLALGVKGLDGGELDVGGAQVRSMSRRFSFLYTSWPVLVQAAGGLKGAPGCHLKAQVG